jgi:DNA-binding transcriptional ArsR family regulator
MRRTNRSQKKIRLPVPGSSTVLRRGSAARAALAGVAPVFAALGDGTRLSLVARLCARGPLSIVRLGHGMDVTRQAVTKHLYALAGAGLMRAERKGRERIWRITGRRLAHARAWLDRIAAQWDETLNRLRARVESPGGRKQPHPDPAATGLRRAVLRLRGKSHLLRHHHRVTAERRKPPAHRRGLKARRHVGID